MNIPNPAAVKALKDRQRAEEKKRAESLATSATTDPTRPDPSGSKTGILESLPGHELTSTEDSRGLVVKCECGYLPDSPEDQARHLQTVKTKSVRKPFVPSERLTQRPFGGNKDLYALRDQLRKQTTRKESGRNNSKAGKR